MDMSRSDIPIIFEQFACKGTYLSHYPYGTGHIHGTWLVETTEPEAPDYILQQINRDVFRNIPALMENIQLVTSRLKEAGSRSPELVPTTGNQSCYVDPHGVIWRMFVYIPDSLTFEHAVDERQAFEAGKTIGNFQYLLSDLAPRLNVTLPGFHDLDSRMIEFREAIHLDPVSRTTEIKPEADAVEDIYPLVAPLQRAMATQQLPLRVTHNDTKLNNILFDRDLRAICLIDLDTVMPGCIHFDFGDAIRTMANTAGEDEKELARIRFDLRIFEAFSRGYLQEASRFISQEEKEWLPLAPAYMTFIIGLRFLTDHIHGDRYFHIHHEGHNLDRARVQFAFARELLRHQEKIRQGLAV
jgi:hypothetical protein